MNVIVNRLYENSKIDPAVLRAHLRFEARHRNRSAYYFASYRFVKYLVEMKDMAIFMKLYSSESPGTDMKTLYGLSREDVIRAVFGP